MATEQLYDDIAKLYHLIYFDWPASVERQGEILDGLLRRVLGGGDQRILDVSCGIGTQTLGLASRGHALTASDLSESALARARREAEGRGLQVDFSVADMRDCDRHHEGTFDAVISCDNSVPHLDSDEELLKAFGAFYRSTRPGGVALLSVRDYAREDRSTPQLRPFGIREADGERWVVFQVWDWDEDGKHYDFAMYFVRDRGDGPPKTLVSRARYYAVDTDTLLSLLREAGFEKAERIDDVFFQPMLLARKAGG